MCMPNTAAGEAGKGAGSAPQPQSTTPASAVLADTPPGSGACPPDRPFDAKMNMCMPGAAQSKPLLMFQLNQFAAFSDTFGPRGQSRLTGPGMWMVTYARAMSPGNQLRIDLMGSAEPLTVGDRGTPQLLQTEHVDSMHAHDTVMALEFRDVLTLDAHGAQTLTFLFAPRGEAAVGPVPFMHRESAEGNPDAPLGHNLQDGFHDVSTVLGMAYETGPTTVEATAFSGHDIRGPFPTHRPDSYALRVTRSLDGHVGVGGSYSDVRLTDDAGAAEHDEFVSAWLTTSHEVGGHDLKSTFIWARVRPGRKAARNSLLEEAVYQRGDNRFYGRAEVLQVAPGQLDLELAGDGAEARWVEAITLGYERALYSRDGLSLFVGGSYTKDVVPASFSTAYGPEPGGAKLYLRLKVNASVTGGGGAPRP